MNVELVHYTGKGHPDPLYAGRLLAFTKNTRLEMTPSGFSSFFDDEVWPEAKVLAELEYMAGTIPSSWEFCDVVFSINGISRATAQQVTRTRNASFAMQSQRVTDMSDVEYDPRPGEKGFKERMANGVVSYRAQIDEGTTLEDARDLLPIGVHCNLVAKYNFRAFVELVQKRDSLRVQGPYVEMVGCMKAEVIKVWPWAAIFFVPKNARAIAMIEAVARDLADKGAMYKGPAGALAKAADLLKGG